MSMVTLRPQRLLTKPAPMEKKAPAGLRQEGSVGRIQQQEAWRGHGTSGWTHATGATPEEEQVIRYFALVSSCQATSIKGYESAGCAVCLINCHASSACHHTQPGSLALPRRRSLTRQEEGGSEGRQLLAVKAAVGVHALGLLCQQHVREEHLEEVWHGCDAAGDTLQPLQRGCE